MSEIIRQMDPTARFGGTHLSASQRMRCTQLADRFSDLVSFIETIHDCPEKHRAIEQMEFAAYLAMQAIARGESPSTRRAESDEEA